MSLAAFAAIVFAVAGAVCLVSGIHITYITFKRIDFSRYSDADFDAAFDDMFDNAKWYTHIALFVVEPAAYISVAGLLLAVGAAIFSLT